MTSPRKFLPADAAFVALWLDWELRSAEKQVLRGRAWRRARVAPSLPRGTLACASAEGWGGVGLGRLCLKAELKLVL